MGILAETGKGLLKGMAGPIAGAAIGGFQSIVQRNWQKKMWEKMNRYNSPQYQMSRYRAAGLNPNLIYQSGNAGNATQVQPYQKPNTDITKSILESQQVKQSKAQIGLLENQSGTELEKQNLMKAQAFAELKRAGLADAQAFEIMETLYPNIAKTTAETERAAAATGESYAKTALYNQQIKEVQANTSFKKAQTLLTQKEINLKSVVTEIESIKRDYMNTHPGMRIEDSTIMKMLLETVNMTVDSLKEIDIKYTNWLKSEHPMIYNMIMPKSERVNIGYNRYPNINNNLNK